jgi:hypothetical protein
MQFYVYTLKRVDFFSLEQALSRMVNIPGTRCIHKEAQSVETRLIFRIMHTPFEFIMMIRISNVQADFLEYDEV